MKKTIKKKLIIFIFGLNILMLSYIGWVAYTYLTLIKPQEYVKNGAKINYEVINPKFSFFPLKIRAEKINYKIEEVNKNYKSVIFSNPILELSPFGKRRLIAPKAVAAMVLDINQKGLNYINVKGKAKDVDIKFNSSMISSLLVKNISADITDMARVNIDKYFFDCAAKNIDFDMDNLNIKYLTTLSAIPSFTIDKMKGVLNVEPSMKILNDVWKNTMAKMNDEKMDTSKLLGVYLKALRESSATLDYKIEMLSKECNINFTSLIGFKDKKANGKLDFIVQAPSDSKFFPTMFATMNNLPWNLKAKNLEYGKWQVSVDIEDDVIKNENREITNLNF